MKYWNIRTGPMADAIHDARFDEFALIEENGKVNVTNGHWCELELRVIDAEAISWFRHGNCAALALALHDLTGWPLTLVARNADPDLLADTWMHVLVRYPDGRYLDITGTHTETDIQRDWAQYATGEDTDGAVTLHAMGDRDTVVAITDDLTAMDPFEAAVVRDFAEHLLTQHPLPKAA